MSRAIKEYSFGMVCAYAIRVPNNLRKKIVVWHEKLFLDFLDFSVDAVDKDGIIEAQEKTKDNGEKIMKNYFGKSIAANADIQRHNEKIADLRKTLADAETNNDGSRCAKMEIEAYRNFLRIALESKANVASTMFKRK